MAQLQVALDGLAQVVAAHAGHDHVGNHQVRNLLLHPAQRRCRVEIDGHVVIRAQQDLHIIGNVDVVVHHGDSLAVGLLLGGRRRLFHGRGGDVVYGLDGRPLVVGVGRRAHGQDEGEHGAALFPVRGLDIAVVQAGERAGIVQADARSVRIALVVSLVEPLENLLQLAFRDALSSVGYGNLRILAVRIGLGKLELPGRILARDDVEGECNATTRRRKLHRVGQEVHDDLLHLVHIGPHGEGVLQSVGLEFDALGAGVEAEQVRDALQRSDDVALGHLQLQFLVSDPVEVQQLVHEGQHPGGTALDDAHQLAVLALDAFRGGELRDRACDHGERGTELVRHVGEVVHLDLAQAALLLFLLLHAFALAARLVYAPRGVFADAPDASDQDPQAPQDNGAGQEIEDPGPPGSVPGR